MMLITISVVLICIINRKCWRQ